MGINRLRLSFFLCRGSLIFFFSEITNYRPRHLIKFFFDDSAVSWPRRSVDCLFFGESTARWANQSAPYFESPHFSIKNSRGKLCKFRYKKRITIEKNNSRIMKNWSRTFWSWYTAVDFYHSLLFTAEEKRVLLSIIDIHAKSKL